MEIQNRLMLEQIKVLGSSIIGKKLMGNNIPGTLDEFRANTPLTTYADYSPYLPDKIEDVLPEKPFVWARTSGRTSDRGPKWFPYTKYFYDHLSDPVIGAMLLSSCKKPGHVALERNDKFLMATAPRPYTSGYISRSAYDNLNVVFLPNLDDGEKMSYGDRVTAGFRLAMQQGLDYFMGLSLVLARMGEQFEKQSNSTKPTKDLLNIFTLTRLLKAVITAKVKNRNILPKDIWNLKGIMSGGTDTSIYRDKIEYYWGKKPLEGYACTEGGNLAMQAWNFKGMTFFPDAVFLEFIPLDEVNKNKKDPSYRPRTVLFNELEIGIYELVITNFNGGALVRYRMFDLFEIISIGDEQINSVLPQVKFYSRTDDVIDIGNYLRLTERDVWETLEEAGIQYLDWSANKEVVNENPVLHLYIEFKEPPTQSDEEMLEILDKHFSDRFQEYKDIKENLGLNPLLFSRLPQGSFAAYTKSKLDSGADLAHLKPPHMRPTPESLKHLLTILTQ